MGPPSTLFRFRIELSDVERSVYETLDFRVAQHPSETLQYLLSRVIAYALNVQDGLEFASGGLSNPDDPALSKPNTMGGTALWIEIGNPSPRKLHKASKASQKVRVYTYKDPELLVRDVAGCDVHKASEIEIYGLKPAFLDRVAARLAKDNRWSLLLNDGSLTISNDEMSEETELRKYSVSES